ncbi:MAG TPA: nuclear transport factor 2 family protein [Myxococcaceae bacterium]|nr:nuclear transport factor 2 family protein [Myxococcaceae bacterium]
MPLSPQLREALNRLDDFRRTGRLLPAWTTAARRSVWKVPRELRHRLPRQRPTRLTLNGDSASGVSYCLVTLIGMENGRRTKTSMLVIYNDTYVRRGGTWLIADRKSNFVTREQEEVR